MLYIVILILICGIKSSIQLNFVNGTSVCRNVTTGVTTCCYNHEEINGKCLQCRIGTVSEHGDQCQPCKQNVYGYKCLEKCNCDQFQRCDAAIGCIQKNVILTNSTTNAGIFSGGSNETLISSAGFHGTTEERADINSKIPASRRHVTETDKLFTDVPTEIFTTEEIHALSSGSSDMEWLIYTLCIVGVVIVTGLSHLLRSYRKQKSSNEMLQNEDLVLEQVAASPYSGIYDVIDEELLTYDNNDFVPQENHSITKRTEPDDTGYLDPCFATQEDEEQKLKVKLSQEEGNSNTSSNSDIEAQNDTEYLNPYHTLQENWKEDSHCYEAAVTVHPGTESSSGSDEKTTNYKYAHVYQPLQKDSDTKRHAYEKPQT